MALSPYQLQVLKNQVTIMQALHEIIAAPKRGGNYYDCERIVRPNLNNQMDASMTLMMRENG